MRSPNINAILKASPRNSRYGAPMGARNYADDLDNARVYLQRVRMVDGDYAPDGTYWGGGRGTLPLWCAFTVAGNVRMYVRAASRAGALAAIADECEEVAAYIRK